MVAQKHRMTLVTNVAAGTHTVAEPIPASGRYKLYAQGTAGASPSIVVQSRFGSQTVFQAVVTTPTVILGNATIIDLVEGEEIRIVVLDYTGLTVQLAWVGA